MSLNPGGHVLIRMILFMIKSDMFADMKYNTSIPTIPTITFISNLRFGSN